MRQFVKECLGTPFISDQQRPIELRANRSNGPALNFGLGRTLREQVGKGDEVASNPAVSGSVASGKPEYRGSKRASQRCRHRISAGRCHSIEPGHPCHSEPSGQQRAQLLSPIGLACGRIPAGNFAVANEG